ncbi:hypothetical protein ACLB2K_013995 [Fragaria x ananassa]
MCFSSTSEDSRWLRVEQHWAHERDSLLCEIADLKFKLQDLQAVSSSIASPAANCKNLSPIRDERRPIMSPSRHEFFLLVPDWP